MDSFYKMILIFLKSIYVIFQKIGMICINNVDVYDGCTCNSLKNMNNSYTHDSLIISVVIMVVQNPNK